MKKLLLLLLMPIAVLSASAQSNDYNMVIELKNGTKVTLGANDVESLTFNGEALSVSGNTIADLYSKIAELKTMITMYHSGEAKKVFSVNDVSFTMIKVGCGTFQMGEKEWATPVHQVTLTNDYYIGETEVTQELWQAVMGSNPSNFKGNKLPVEQVSWNDCQTFIAKLNELTGMNFRLPTEAEWEFAVRGGNASLGYTYSGSNIVGDVAWYENNSNNQTHEVATKAPNELGIYDMIGNVFEWCQEWYGDYSSSAQTNPTGPASGSYRVLRGGAWNSDDYNCRMALRNGYWPSYPSYDLGLRLAF